MIVGLLLFGLNSIDTRMYGRWYKMGNKKIKILHRFICISINKQTNKQNKHNQTNFSYNNGKKSHKPKNEKKN